MSIALDEAADLLSKIAGEAGSKKERQLRAWRRLVARFPNSTWSFNRVHDLFTRDERACPRREEIAELQELAKVNETISLARQEYDEILSRLARCESLLGLQENEIGVAGDARRKASS